MTVIQNTAGNIIIESFYPILNVMAEVEEPDILLLAFACKRFRIVPIPFKVKWSSLTQYYRANI